MVDAHLPVEEKPRPLRYLVLDLNSYFASVEQQERPELRGRPVAVAPVLAETSFCIAASYQAKRFGVKCGTRIKEAREMCPGLVVVEARHLMYLAYHKRILDVAESILPVEKALSIDEMMFRLLGTERTPEVAIELAYRIKEVLRTRVGQCITCSIGIAPNPFLAKVASDMQKPAGLTVLQADDLPHALHGLELTDLVGINRRMKVRLNAAGIFSVEGLCAASKQELLGAFGSILGERWWYLLRGVDLGQEVRSRRSLSHSHVLPPELRTDQGCREVLLRLLQKASARLRSNDLWACAMEVGVSAMEKSWWAKTRLPPTQDTITLNEHFMRLWQARDFVRPQKVSVNFYELREPEQVTLSLFDPTEDRALLSRAVDRVNQRFGKNRIYLAGMERAKDTGPERIAFDQTSLFSEGKGDND